MRLPAAPSFNAARVFSHLLKAWRRSIGEGIHNMCAPLQKYRMVTLKGQKVVRFLFQGLGCHSFLAIKRICRKHAPFKVQHARQLGTGRYFIAFSSTVNCPSTRRFSTDQALSMCKAFPPLLAVRRCVLPSKATISPDTCSRSHRDNSQRHSLKLDGKIV